MARLSKAARPESVTPGRDVYPEKRLWQIGKLKR